MSNRIILGLTFLNAHAALHGVATMYRDLLRQKGKNAELIDLTQPSGIADLERHLKSGNVDFCFAPQGVGSRLMAGDQTVWKRFKVPFVGLHGDNPCYNIFNHFSDSRYVANLYMYQSFADLHRRYIQSDQVVEVMPFQTGALGVPPIAFRDRTIPMLYLKAGESVQECVANINGMPTNIRDSIWQQLERAQQSPNLLVCDLVQELFDAHKLTRKENFDLFWGCAHWMDMYLRRKRAMDFVDWMKMQPGAIIVGSGWDFIDKTKARATFKDSMPINKVLDLYFNSRIVCNTSPYGRDVLHERVSLALLSECIAISDTNVWWDEHFGNVPALKRYDWSKDIGDQLQPIMNMTLADMEAIAPTGRSKALQHFSGKDIAADILACIEKVRQTAA